jgi:hypothetical protein
MHLPKWERNRETGYAPILIKSIESRKSLTGL